MKHFTILAAVAALLAVGLFGCTNSSPSSQASAATTPRQAVVTSGGQGGATVIFLQSSDPDNPVMLSTSGGDVCPECRAAAIKYFKTGVLDPHCSTCGATRTLANPVDISHISHN